ncbi:hypothetical protein FOXYSP1_20267 [Fusarium oxysporum f. sp. phaseoli]
MTAAVTSGDSTDTCSASTSLFTQSILHIIHQPSLSVVGIIVSHS